MAPAGNGRRGLGSPAGPRYQTIRRSIRLTIVGSVNFYGCRYGLDNPVLATYALFGTIATGALAQLPGAAPQRARRLLTTLPMVWILVTLGTVLAVSTWAAAAGMLVIGLRWRLPASAVHAWSGSPPHFSSSTSWPASPRTSPTRFRRG
jgi:hypothetical protein